MPVLAIYTYVGVFKRLKEILNLFLCREFYFGPEAIDGTILRYKTNIKGKVEAKRKKSE